MKFLVSGSNGLLGGTLMLQLRNNGHITSSLDRKKIRLENKQSLLRFLDSELDGVDYFIHAAANTNVEQCEENRASCYRDNVLLTEVLADAARRNGVPMIYISSTGVYGGDIKRAYCEYDDPNPKTIHHKSKFQAERLVMAANWLNLVIRTGWLFGGSVTSEKNFVVNRVLEARNATCGSILSNDQQRGCPTYTVDVAKHILLLVASGARGVFNLVNEGSASRYEYVKEVIALAGLNVEVCRADANTFNRIAPVSDNEMAVNWRNRELGYPALPTWQEALAEYIGSEPMRSFLQ